MFTKSRAVVVFVVIALLVLSTQTVFANFSNGPENPGGGIVFRGEEIFLFATEDYMKGLTALHNGDVVEWCETGEEPLVYFDFQVIESPANENRIIEIDHGEDVPTEVWPFLVDWEAEDICEQFLESEPIASGYAKMRVTDNDLFVWAYPNKNANAFGWVSQGRLLGPEGEVVHFNSIFRATWDGIDGERVSNFVEKINLK